MWTVYRDGQLIRSFINKEDAYKLKDAIINKDIATKDYGHKLKVVEEK